MTTLKNLTRGFILLTASTAFFVAPHAQGLVFFVTDTNDGVRISNLRGAIVAANRIGGNNAIILGQPFGQRRNNNEWTFRLTIPGADETNARTGDLDITRGNLTIIGTSPNVAIVATGLGDRVFHILPHTRLMLENLIVKGGTAPLNDDGNNEYRAYGGAIFNSGTLTIQNCSIIANSSGNGGLGAIGVSQPGGSGGGIYNEGYARLSDCIVSGNNTGNGAGPDNFGLANSGGNGAGIYNSGIIILDNCIISNNICGRGGIGGVQSEGLVPINAPGNSGGAGGCGAGIFNTSEMTLNFCALNNNVAGDGGIGSDSGSTGGNGGAGGNGAGIFNVGILNLNTCTVSGNFCGTGGIGGSGWFGSAGTGGDGGNGGGIYNTELLNILSCTIAFNEAGAGGTGGNNNNALSPATGGQGGYGGGVLNDASETNVVMRNTLIALNMASIGGAGGTNADETIGNAGFNGAGFDLAGGFASGRFNLIGMADGSIGFTNGINADQVGSNANPINPLLGPLQMNGGFTPTHALLPGSPAIDQGNCFGIHTDQRGHHRPHNYPSISNAVGGDGSDIGAFELDTR